MNRAGFLVFKYFHTPKSNSLSFQGHGKQRGYSPHPKWSQHPLVPPAKIANQSQLPPFKAKMFHPPHFAVF